MPVPSVRSTFLSFCTVTPRSNFICQRPPVALDLRDHPFGERVDNRNSDAVKAAGNLVSTLTELGARMEDRHDDFDGRQLLFGVNVDWDAAAVVFDRARAVRIEDDANVVRVPRERLVDGIVDRLVDQLMQAALGGIADIHARALAHRFKPP